jgi:hypothetical protein
MVAFLKFLQDYEMVVYYLSGLAALRYLYLLIAAQVRLSKSSFDLERKLNQGQRNQALGYLALIVSVAVGVHFAVLSGLPEAQRAEQVRMAANAVTLPTITPTPTPLELFGVDVSGCNNPKARLLSPKPGEAVKGKVTVQIVADIENFAFFKLELGRPDEPEVWVMLYTNNNTPSTPEETPSPALERGSFSWVWDSSTVTPGVYHLRLTVFQADLTYPPPCVVPIQVLSTGP